MNVTRFISRLLLSALLAFPLFAGAATQFTSGKFQAIGADGLAVPGCLLYTYSAGTLTPLSTYTNQGGATPNANPVVCDAAGQANVWLGTSSYRMILKTAAGVTVWDVDNVSNPTSTADLASTASAALGDALVGVKKTTTGAVATTQHEINERTYSALDPMSAAQIADIRARTAAVNVTTPLQSALDFINTGVVGSYELGIPDGTYSITNTGSRILQIQSGSKTIGSSLEGTGLKVATGSTATAAIEDSGSAAKVELQNITIYGNSNASLTSGLRLGRRTTQFGTYGTLDNIMVRDMPNAIGFDLNANVVAAGKLYTLNTASGLVHNAAGSGLHIESFTPYGFTAIGYQMALGDSANFVEAEAPASDDAIPLVYERGGAVSNFYLAIGASRSVKTAVQINPTYVDDFYLGPTAIARASDGTSGTSRYGDSASPADSGTATSGTTTTLTDTSKSWGLDQWKGGAIYITGGTGSGQWQRINSNTARTISANGTWGTTPDATSTYALDYFIKKTGGGGFAHSETMSAYWPAFYNASVTNQLRASTAVVGKYTDALPLTGLLTVVATLDFVSVAANAVGTSLTVTVTGAAVNDAVVVTPNATAQAQGIVYTGVVTSANTVTIYPKNVTTGAIDPASGSFTVMVFTRT